MEDVEDQVVLVDEKDNQIGAMGKLMAHRTGALHRAFSIFVFNDQGKLLLQQRAKGKYHSGGLWTNTCCSHPRPGEDVIVAAHCRLKEEMGFDCELKNVYNFMYQAALDNNLVEHEFDHVLAGRFNGSPNPNREEAENWKWADPAVLKHDMAAHPQNYTYWFRTCFSDVMARMRALNTG